MLNNNKRKEPFYMYDPEVLQWSVEENRLTVLLELHFAVRKQNVTFEVEIYYL
jgi:hypothetical protein